MTGVVSVGFRSRAILPAGKVLIGKPNQSHGWFQIRLIIHDRRDVSGFRSPAVWARLAFGQNPLLVGFRQANVAVAVTVDVHEHGSSDEKGVFVDSRVRPLRHAGQGENPPSQLLIKSCLRFHNYIKV